MSEPGFPLNCPKCGSPLALALVTVTHKERAELYQEQFQSKSLTVTIEPAE